MLSRVSSKLLSLCLFLYVAKIRNNSDMTKFILHFLENIFTSTIIQLFITRFSALLPLFGNYGNFHVVKHQCFTIFYPVFVSYPAIYTLASLQVVVILFVR